LNPVAGYGNPATGYGINHTAVYGMQAEVKTLAANPAFIPLSVGAGAAGHSHHIRPTPLQINRSHYQPKYQNANSYYNRTKRKRDSSSGSASHTPLRGGSPGNLSNMPPWVQPDNPYSKEPIIGLHEEINDFYQWITPTQEEHYMRLGVVGRIEACVKKLWPSAALHIFGSFRTGLYLPTSDIDLALFGKWETLPLRTLEAALLEDDIADPATLKVLDKASVPIIKMMDKRTRVRVDVSFNMVNGIKSVELVKMYKKKYPPLSKLIYVLKQFLLQRDLNEVFTGGLSSYCLILMVVSFLQVHARHDVVDEDANLGVLLLEFFELYGKNFDYQSLAIRVTGTGAYVPKDEIQEEMPAGSRPSLLCVEDPLQPGNDVGKSSYGALRVRQAFDYAFGALERSLAGVAEAPTLLSTIIQVDPATVEYRDWIRTSTSIPQEVKDGSVSPIPEPDVVPGATPASVQHHHHPATPPPTPPTTSPSHKTNNNNNSVEGKDDVVVTVVDHDEDDDVIILEETEEECEEEEEEEGGEESDDIPSSPDRPSSPELIDLTREDEDNNSTTSTNNEADNNGCADTPAMSISPVTSEAGDDVRSVNGKCNTAAVFESSSPVPTTSTGADALTQQAPKKNATRASKPLYKPPVARYSNWNGPAPTPAGARKITMTRADLDMNWRASARGPGSDQSSNSGGEVATTKRYNDKGDKDGWKENTKPPSGSKSRKHAEGKREGGKKDDNRVANNTSYNHHISSPTDKRLNHHHPNKSDTKNRKENRNRKHEAAANKNGNNKNKHAASGTAAGDAAVESSSSGIGSTTSSRLSSGGSSDAVDSCAATPPTNRPAQRVPDLHGGEPAIIQVGGGVANKGNNAKDSLSRRASASSCNNSIDNKTHALSSPVTNSELNALVKKSKKKRKKHELNGATNKENGVNGVSRDSSPGGGNVGYKSDNKTVIQNSKNASNRFSCEAGPRIPKR